VHLHPKKLKDLLADGHITQRQYEQGIEDWNRNKAIADDAEKAEIWKAELEKASMTQKKKMIKDKVIDLRVEAALAEDTFDSRSKRRKASGLNFALRGSGGVSF